MQGKLRSDSALADPLIAALSVVLIAATLIVVVLVERLVGVARAVQN